MFDKNKYDIEYGKAYRQTPNGKEKHNTASSKYKKSQKGKLANKKYYEKHKKLKLKIMKTKPKYKSLNIQIDKKHRRRLNKEEKNFIIPLLDKGICMACGKSEPIKNRRLSVDHCHKTGKIRGVLCSNCNRALGLLNDDISVLSNLFEYLSNI